MGNCLHSLERIYTHSLCSVVRFKYYYNLLYMVGGEITAIISHTKKSLQFIQCNACAIEFISFQWNVNPAPTYTSYIAVIVTSFFSLLLCDVFNSVRIVLVHICYSCFSHVTGSALYMDIYSCLRVRKYWTTHRLSIFNI